jgi:hypothetical protein
VPPTSVLRYCLDPCGEPVTSRTGGLWIDMDAVSRHESAYRAWKSEHYVPEQGGMVLLSARQLDAAPARVSWRISHWRCLPADVNDYGLDLPVDHAGWLSHVAHVMEKSWVVATDLAALIREASSGAGRCRPTPPDGGG